MTDQFNKLADALENIAQMEYPSAHHDGKNLREASALLRAAAGVDAAGMMALHDAAAKAAQSDLIDYLKGVYAFIESTSPAGFAVEAFRLPPSATRNQRSLFDALTGDASGELSPAAGQDSEVGGSAGRHAEIAVLESALRLVLAQRVPPGCVVVPVERLTVEEIKTLRQQVRNDPRCQDEHWFVLMARAIEDRYLAAALTDQSQKKESP